MAGPLRTYYQLNCYEVHKKNESYVSFDKILLLDFVQLKPLSKRHLSVVIIIYNNGQIVIYLPVW